MRPVGSPNSARASTPCARSRPCSGAGVSSIAVWKPPWTNTAPSRCSQAGAHGHLGHHALAQLGIELRQGRVQGRLVAHRMAGEEARQLELVIAEQEQTAAFIDQAEHDAQRPGVVRPVVGEVAKLHHEAVGGGGVAECDGIAVHVAHHADGRVLRDGSDEPCRRAACGEVSRSAMSQVRS